VRIRVSNVLCFQIIKYMLILLLKVSIVTRKALLTTHFNPKIY